MVEPIMQPLFGAPDPIQQYPGPTQMYQQPTFGGPPMPGHSYAPMPDTQQMPSTGFYQPTEHQEMSQPTINYQNFQNFSHQEPRQTMSPPVAEPPKQKLPLPEEYIYMQTVFEELKTQCFNAATNPVSKNKFFYWKRNFHFN